MFSKAICALASNLYAAIKGPFLTATESMFKDTYLAATGKSRKEIAVGLHLSENTVKMHTTSLFKALKVTSRDGIFALLEK